MKKVIQIEKFLLFSQCGKNQKTLEQNAFETLAATDISQNSQLGFIFVWSVQRCVQTAALPLLMQALGPTEGSAVSELSCWPLPSVMLWLQHSILITLWRGSGSTAGFSSKLFFLQDLYAEIPVNFLGRSALTLMASAQDEVGVFPCAGWPRTKPPQFGLCVWSHHPFTGKWQEHRDQQLFVFFPDATASFLGSSQWKVKSIYETSEFSGMRKYFHPYCRLKVSCYFLKYILRNCVLRGLGLKPCMYCSRQLMPQVSFQYFGHRGVHDNVTKC